MNRPAVILAACHFLDRADESVSRRSVQAFLRLTLGKGFSSDEVAPIVSSFKNSGPLEVKTPAAPGPKIATNEREPGQTSVQTRSTHAGVVKVLELEDIDPNGSMPSLLGDQLPAPKPAKKAASKPVRIASAYAGTTLESFGDHEPLVREVLAADGFAVTTKAFEGALRSLAMWRATYGEAAFARGLAVAADKSFGHRYVGGVAKRFDPDRDQGQQRGFERREEPDEPNSSTLLPTTTDLIAAGKLQPISAADVDAERPDWFKAHLAAQEA